MKLVHFFFLEIGLGKLHDNLLYLKNIYLLSKYNPTTEIRIWDEEKLDLLVKNEFPELLDFWNHFPSKFYKIDFGRYLVLKKYGGMYVDLDMESLCPLPDPNEMDFINIFTDEKGVETFNTNVIYFRDSNMYEKLIQFSYDRFKNNKMPSTWKIRHLLYTVGARMYHKFCRENKLNKTNVGKYFKDEMTKTWLKVDL